MYYTAIALTLLCISVSFAKAEGGNQLYNYVTCGSVLKLANVGHGVRLHSHEVRYGSGSGQQSVTGLDASDDANSYWRVRGGAAASDADCRRGSPIRCGSLVRLTHQATGKNLHSHLYSSPITHQQEVSAFGGSNGESDRGDDWQVLCGGGGTAASADQLWRRSERVRLRHSVTDQFLHVSGQRYGRPIAGQAEISAVPAASDAGSYWLAAEGVFVKPSVGGGDGGPVPTVERPAFVVGGGASGDAVHDSGEL